MVAVLKEWLTESDEDAQARNWSLPNPGLTSTPERPPVQKRRAITGSDRGDTIGDLLQLQETLGEIQHLLSGDGQIKSTGEPLLTIETVIYASSWISRLFTEVVRSGARWIKPQVVANPDGEIVFTWWRGLRMLTIYVAGDKAEYLESWGTSIHTEMADGNADSPSVYRALWSRLLRG